MVRNLPDTVYRKLLKKKKEDGFEGRDWADWLAYVVRDVKLEDDIHSAISRATREGLFELWVRNFARNLASIWEEGSIADLVPPEEEWFRKPSVVIGRGPSVFRKKHVELLSEYVREEAYTGYVVATDGMFLDCLRRDLLPDYVVNVDGHPTKIVRWFGDPDFDENNPGASEEEKRRNEEDMELVESFQPEVQMVKVVLSATASPNVYRRVREIGMEVYWWIPLFDDPNRADSFTRLMKMMTKCDRHPRGLPAMVAGGNCGCASWVLSHAILRCTPIALIGIDLGYTEDTLLDETSYYKQFLEGAGGDAERAARALWEVYNPYFKVKARIDPVFEHYRQAWLSMLDDVDPRVETINCTEGGTLFSNDPSKRLKYMRFKEFLERYGGGKGEVEEEDVC